jgi:predicted Rdx family selenoprotein
MTLTNKVCRHLARTAWIELEQWTETSDSFSAIGLFNTKSAKFTIHVDTLYWALSKESTNSADRVPVGLRNRVKGAYREVSYGSTFAEFVVSLEALQADLADFPAGDVE